MHFLKPPDIYYLCCSYNKTLQLNLVFWFQGIYRVSGVKSKVEHLCTKFDADPESVDLDDIHPNIISNVLKLYLRQVSELRIFTIVFYKIIMF